MAVTLNNQVIETPEHDKVAALNHKNDWIGDFLGWLQARYTLCKWEEDEDGDEFLLPTYPRTDHIVAEFFDIDLDAFWKEKDAMLAAYRKQQEAKENVDN